MENDSELDQVQWQPDPLQNVYNRKELIKCLDKAARSYSRVSLEYATLLPGNYSGLDLSRIAGEGLSARFCDFTGCSFQKSNLSHSNLGGSILTDADLSGADLNHAEMRGAILYRARCVETIFSWADLTGAVFTQANLMAALLGSALLTDADLRLAALRGARCLGADFTRAELAGAVFAQAEYELREMLGARDLDKVVWEEYVIPEEGEIL